MPLTAESKERRLKALTRLALATREKVESAVYVLYIEDTAGFSTEAVERACHRLELTTPWFPKVAELIEACRSEAEREAERRATRFRQLPAGDPVSPEKLGEFLAQIKAVVRKKAMR